MGKIRRLGLNTFGVLTHKPEGKYVSYEDYATVERQRNAWKGAVTISIAERDALKKVIHLMCANLGHPNASNGIRLALRTGKQALDDTPALLEVTK